MKYALRIVGLLAIIFALYIIVGEQLVGSSSNAYVNTRLATLRMPLEGTIQISTAPVGGRISAGEVIGTATQQRNDNSEIAWILDGRLQAAADLRAYEADPEISPVVLDQALERLKAYEEAREAMRGQQVAASSAALRSPVTGVIWSLAAHSGAYLPRGEPLARIAELDFHGVVAQYSDNPILAFTCRFLQRLLKDLTVAQDIYVRSDPVSRARGIQHQRDLIAAMRRRDADAAAGILFVHMAEAERQMLDLQARLMDRFLTDEVTPARTRKRRSA